MATASVAQASLGLRPEFEQRLTSTQRMALERLAAYDLALVHDRLLAEGRLPVDWVDEAVLEFRRFFGLCILAAAAVPMYSQAVDEAWHACILFTRLYADLCQRTTGDFVHHDPVALDTSESADGGFAAFKQAYEAAYGPLGALWRFPRLWWSPPRAQPA